MSAPGDTASAAAFMQLGAMSSPGRHATLFDALPTDVPPLARIVQGLLLHQHWAGAYGQMLSPERTGESHIRSVEAMLDRLLVHDAAPLALPRPPERRLVGICRHFALLMAAMLRAKGVPARARCGFAAYFEPGRFVDHWVCEYWNEGEGRWILADAQIDEVQGGAIEPDFDVLDVPRDRFVVAGDAWAQCRTGKSDPAAFGILDMWGLWFVAGNLLRDAAALNGMEMLPWDVWGAMPEPGAHLTEDQHALLDRLAALTREPERSLAELRHLYETDERLRVPSIVFNAVLNRPETV
ncbi:transglutaminase-like domain-containing protein [Parvibaculum sp.]|uniref:transglutaminase-like domain-containing protein n=1 Tax=Parvibaculum sp. TaxID=2024848 RepID=UPI002CEC2D64|nr:transglutaminase-like domain-containing protein [Parvibaculum sp.]HUD53361.1 transglutaminase-like domain-containing protein [Parvibaculum sp.]